MTAIRFVSRTTLECSYVHQVVRVYEARYRCGYMYCTPSGLESLDSMSSLYSLCCILSIYFHAIARYVLMCSLVQTHTCR